MSPRQIVVSACQIEEASADEREDDAMPPWLERSILRSAAGTPEGTTAERLRRAGGTVYEMSRFTAGSRITGRDGHMDRTLTVITVALAFLMSLPVQPALAEVLRTPAAHPHRGFAPESARCLG
jgi:hypothetical protein